MILKNPFTFNKVLLIKKKTFNKVPRMENGQYEKYNFLYYYIF